MPEENCELINVEVAYALPQKQAIISIEVKTGTTALEAIEQSGLLLEYPELSLKNCKIGVFGKVVSLAAVLQPLDRVEIYRSLIADAKEARRLRAATKKGSVANKDSVAKGGQQKRQKE
ncbi:MAG TPA: RnfH family protein [Methylophilus sp.]|nr:RnfH family protein [Methylophilus sp.]